MTVTEQEKKIQELTEEIARLRDLLTYAVNKACFNCEEYVGKDTRRCSNCTIKKIKEKLGVE